MVVDLKIPACITFFYGLFFSGTVCSGSVRHGVSDFLPTTLTLTLELEPTDPTDPTDPADPTHPTHPTDPT